MSTAQLQDVTSTFSHLMSPWHTPRACAWATACSSWQEIQSCTARLQSVCASRGGKPQGLHWLFRWPFVCTPACAADFQETRALQDHGCSQLVIWGSYDSHSEWRLDYLEHGSGWFC